MSPVLADMDSKPLIKVLKKGEGAWLWLKKVLGGGEAWFPLVESDGKRTRQEETVGRNMQTGRRMVGGGVVCMLDEEMRRSVPLRE